MQIVSFGEALNSIIAICFVLHWTNNYRPDYFSEQATVQTQLLLLLDWTKRSFFGRDISKF
jgi:hypothetical protein